jgi:uncharacterized membrane protein
MKRATTILLPALLLMLCAAASHAKPEYLDVLVQTYKSQSTQLSGRSCTNCHVSDSDFARNPYGKQVGIALEQAGSKDLTPELLHKIESMDLSGGGGTVLDKINAGKSPADITGGNPAKAAATAKAAEPKKSWFPSYAFHPAVVHFPIALFIGGVILDFIGMIRKSRTLLLAGWYNLLFAAVTAVAGIGSGYIALVLMKVPFAGLIKQHILIAVASSIIMWILVGLRVHQHEKMSSGRRALYYLLAFAGFILISYAGHLGGEFVYGG